MIVTPGSLAFRVVLLTTILVAAAVVAIATLVSALYSDAAEKSFERVLSAHLYNLIGSAGLTGGDGFRGVPDLGDVRFTIPRSGWYWSVEPASGFDQPPLRSPSMISPLQAPSPDEVPFDPEFRRDYQMTGLDGEDVRVLESEFLLGEDGLVARFRVMGNQSELRAEVDQFRNRLFVYLGLFGVGVILVNTAAILFGLRPLRAVRAALENVRTGKAEQLKGEFPTEIAPLAHEVNALIESNRKVIQRYRTQVGNLAHSLKTPLAVLSNEAHSVGGKTGTLIGEQTDRMLSQVQHYLQRARIAAQRDSVVFRTPVDPLLERMIRVLGKLNQDIVFSYQPSDSELVFSGESEDLEEIVGNLLENACKWAEARVQVGCALDDSHMRPCLAITIEDDGPGVPEEKYADALKRGIRLDEATPGTGLGLSIVVDMAEEYGGTVALSRSALGGLSVMVRLPRAV